MMSEVAYLAAAVPIGRLVGQLSGPVADSHPAGIGVSRTSVGQPRAHDRRLGLLGGLVNVAAVIVSVVALLVSGATSYRQLTLARQANTLPVLVELFREHRSDHLAEARLFVHQDLPGHDVSEGLNSLPPDKRKLVRDLAWYYDNLGALVAHEIVDIGPVSGYLGGSVVSTWENMEPLVLAHRRFRYGGPADEVQWQGYYENLYRLVKQNPPGAMRRRLERWTSETSSPPRS